MKIIKNSIVKVDEDEVKKFLTLVAVSKDEVRNMLSTTNEISDVARSLSSTKGPFRLVEEVFSGNRTIGGFSEKQYNWYITLNNSSVLLAVRTTDHYFYGVIISKKFMNNYKTYRWHLDPSGNGRYRVSATEKKEEVIKDSFGNTVATNVRSEKLYSYQLPIRILCKRANRAYPEYDNNGKIYEVDHMHRTFDERERKIRYVTHNENKEDMKSHRKTAILSSYKGLLVESIISEVRRGFLDLEKPCIFQ